MSLAAIYEPLLDKGYLPDFLLRAGIRKLCGDRLAQSEQGSLVRNDEDKKRYLAMLKETPSIAIHTKEANEQHYELPTEFFKMCLGKRLKYSSCLYTSPTTTLDEAEELMLASYCEKAGVQDGQKIMDLGCGWGSLTLYLAEKYPNARITSLSNSATQRAHIEGVCRDRGFGNVRVITSDINVFEQTETFDRIISVEMFEHMKNYRALLAKVSTWLVPETGRLFVHIFAHKHFAYDYDTADDDSWMAKYFFTGGTMPSADLFLWFQEHLEVLDRWIVDGTHYQKTSEDWLKNMDAHRAEIMPLMVKTYGSQAAGYAWWNRWRVFYLACAEFFGYSAGNEWCIVHYLFKRR
ncbi:S-adenosyl-L-methionine-dependent methyltransferase [Hyaloraphidium curvatum]|nr:S-adenosyl-L-methionine-dependent methyltransferase [Hyaloraphidium curvatum]